MSGVVEFSDAQLGDEAYTWEHPDGDWGDYKFETINPDGLYEFWEPTVVVRKRWRLVEVEEITLDDFPDDEQ